MSQKKCNECIYGVVVSILPDKPPTIRGCRACGKFSTHRAAANRVMVLLLRAAAENITPKHRCNSCAGTFREDQLASVWPDIEGILSRIAPGGEVPSGECPECGALTYLIEKE